MDRQQFILTAALILFAAFLLGWFACWLVGRISRPTHAEIGALDRLARQLHEAEDQRDSALDAARIRERVLDDEIAVTEAELRRAEGDLAEARTEIEELRAYIDSQRAK